MLKVIFRLFVYKRPHLTGHASYAFPLGQRFSHRDAIACLLLFGSTLGIELLEEMGYQGTDGQQLALALIEVDMTFRQKVYVVVLRIKACICEATHLLCHCLCSYIFFAIHRSCSYLTFDSMGLRSPLYPDR